MHLEVAAVDAVVVTDDHRRKLDVLVLDRLEGPVELIGHDVESAKRLLLELLELVEEVHAGLGHQPNFPVTYCSVRSSLGLVKMVFVSSNSTSSPASMN